MWRMEIIVTHQPGPPYDNRKEGRLINPRSVSLTDRSSLVGTKNYIRAVVVPVRGRACKKLCTDEPSAHLSF